MDSRQSRDVALIVVTPLSPYITKAELARRERVCGDLAVAAGFVPRVLPRDTTLADLTMQHRLDPAEGSAIAAIVTWTCLGLVTSPDDVAICTAFHAAGGAVFEARSGRLAKVEVARLHSAVVAQLEPNHSVTARHAAATFEARRAVASEGGWLGGRKPLGWVFDDRGEAELDAVPANHIRNATRRIVGGATVGSVAAEWNAAGFTTLTGRAWTSGAARRVLLRARNAGLTEYRGCIVGRSAWPAIVSVDEWTALRRRLLRRSDHAVAHDHGRNEAPLRHTMHPRAADRMTR